LHRAQGAGRGAEHSQATRTSRKRPGRDLADDDALFD
jgi:hypothetical protein